MAADGGATEVNILAAVGNILTRRARSEFVAGHRLRKVYGAGMSAETLQLFPREFGVPTLIEGYGLTEVPGVCNNPFLGPQKPGSMGCSARHPDHARVFSEMRVLDDEGREVAAGRTGEIAVRSPITMQGFYRDPEATAAAFCDGWFLTQVGSLPYTPSHRVAKYQLKQDPTLRQRAVELRSRR